MSAQDNCVERMTLSTLSSDLPRDRRPSTRGSRGLLQPNPDQKQSPPSCRRRLRAFARLGEMNLDISARDTILLTHLHIDHPADVPGFLKAGAMTQTQSIEFTIVGPAGVGLYPSTSRFVDLLFGEGGAWAYENSFGAPQKIFSRNLPIDPAARSTVILQTWDGVRVLSVCTHHGDAPADAYRVRVGKCFEPRNARGFVSEND
jgi:hypothetical protein